MSRLSTIAEEDYDSHAEHLENAPDNGAQQSTPGHGARTGLVRTGRLQLDETNGPPALVVVRHLDHNLPLHAVAPLRAAGIIPSRVEAAIRNLEDFAIWIDEQDVVIMDRETREEVEAQVEHIQAPSGRQPLREMSMQEVAMRSNVQAQAPETARVEVEGAGGLAATMAQNKENRCPKTPVDKKPWFPSR